MKVIIIGAGFTGIQLAKRLIADQNDVVLIEKDEETFHKMIESFDQKEIEVCELKEYEEIDNSFEDDDYDFDL